LFFDEISWFSTNKSYFLPSFEHFWNDFCSSRDDIYLIICGSASSWINKNIFNNRGGLYNRITGKIFIRPFNLLEIKEYIKYKKIITTDLDVLNSYMILGGIPYYYNFMDNKLSILQNIDKLFFASNSLLKNEFDNLFTSQFDSPDKYKSVIEKLGKKTIGLSRSDIILETGMESGGELTEILNNLELSGFIRSYICYPKNKKDTLYQLVDHFCLFCCKYIVNENINDCDYWIKNQNSPKINSWRGYSFEMVCLNHIEQIKKKLGITGVLTTVYSWKNYKAQIDLIIVRGDNITNIIEVKYSNNYFIIDLDTYNNIENKKNQYLINQKKFTAIQTVLITTFGLEKNIYSRSIDYEITLEDLMV
jgi:hypothetical protein